MFENIDLWKDIGYKVADGTLEDGEYVCLERTTDTSPEFLENHSPVEDLILFKCFDTYEEQDEWLVNSIVENISAEELHPEDIIVVNTDPLTTRNAVAVVRNKLLSVGVNSNIAGVSTSPDVFFQGDAVKFTGVFRAKGNEAEMVYVMNAQDCYSGWGGAAALVRNRLFTAITRSKGWVRVCGVGKNMAKLAEEFDQVSKHNFQLAFKYPTAEERAKLTIVNRDMSNEEKQRLKRKRLNLEEILESLEAGDTVIEDYPKAVITKLRRLLSKGSV
jgi:superfamily I DNA and RNA helicase